MYSEYDPVPAALSPPAEAISQAVDPILHAGNIERFEELKAQLSGQGRLVGTIQVLLCDPDPAQVDSFGPLDRAASEHGCDPQDGLPAGVPLAATVTIYDELTYESWREGDARPAFLDDVVIERIPALAEAVLDVHLLTRDPNGMLTSATFRVRRPDGALALLTSASFPEPTDGVLGSSPGMPGADDDPTGTVFGPWTGACCVSQAITCGLLSRCCSSSYCYACVDQCWDRAVSNPCHSCGYCGGSDIYCKVPGGHCAGLLRQVTQILFMLFCFQY